MQITSGDMPMLSDLQLVYMVPRNSTELLKINTTKFQVEREPVYLSATFFLHVGVLFLVLWGPFLACPTYPLPKFRRGLMPACPLIPMSSMQYSHSLTASCHFRDILKIVRKYFLIYIFAWLTIFNIRKRNENNIF